MTSSPLLAAAEQLEQRLPVIASIVRQMGWNGTAKELTEAADTLSRLRAALGQAQSAQEAARQAHELSRDARVAISLKRYSAAHELLDSIVLLTMRAALPVSAPPPAREE